MVHWQNQLVCAEHFLYSMTELDTSESSALLKALLTTVTDQSPSFPLQVPPVRGGSYRSPLGEICLQSATAAGGTSLSSALELFARFIGWYPIGPTPACGKKFTLEHLQKVLVKGFETNVKVFPWLSLGAAPDNSPNIGQVTPSKGTPTGRRAEAGKQNLRQERERPGELVCCKELPSGDGWGCYGVCDACTREKLCWIRPKAQLAQTLLSHRGEPDASRKPSTGI